MFRFFKKKTPPPAPPVQPDVAPSEQTPGIGEAPSAASSTPAAPVNTPVHAPQPDSPQAAKPATSGAPAQGSDFTTAPSATSDGAPLSTTPAAETGPLRAAADMNRAQTVPDRGDRDVSPVSSVQAPAAPAAAEVAKPASGSSGGFWNRWASGGQKAEQKTAPAEVAVSPAQTPAAQPPVTEPVTTPGQASPPAPQAGVAEPRATPQVDPAAKLLSQTSQGDAAPEASPARQTSPVSDAAQATDEASGAEVEPTPAPAPAAAPKKASWLGRLKQGLARTGQSLGSLFVGVKVDENLFEELESALIMADAGLEATEKLLNALRARVRKERLDDPAQVKAALRELLADHLRPLERQFDLQKAKPLVVMIAGVNGAGKTTSIGKLAHTFQRQGASVLLAAGDTFRAAAREQLVEWGSRNNVSVIAQEGGDPAAVAFDAVNAGRARQMSVVMVDTAGRLPTQLHLMEELKKIRRVIGKADGDAPHEVLLVVDGNTGQNVLAQIRAFDAAINLTGLVVTKLDGTAKGGTLAAVAAGSNGVRPIPVYWIGVGEGMEDLQPFVADEFAAALLSD